MNDSIWNEKLKLGASALNTLATASVTVGVIAPLAAFLYGISIPTKAGWQLALSALLWVSIGGSLHYGAQRVIGRMRP